jgi:hypothetical protein
MSKTKSSPLLLAVLKFDALSSSTRTLNATQAFDTTSSGITLGSSIGSLSDMTSKLEIGTRKRVTVSTLASANPALEDATALAENLQGVERQDITGGTGGPLQTVRVFAKANDGPEDLSNELKIGVLKSRFIFDGVKMDSLNPDKNITIYDGVITLGLGEYKKWQDKYAVLKTNTVTEKAILRIYEV